MSRQCLLLRVPQTQHGDCIRRAIAFAWDVSVAKAETTDGLLITFGDDTNEADANRFQDYLGLRVGCIESPKACSFTCVHPETQ